MISGMLFCFLFIYFVVGPLQQQMENADAERDVYDELLTQAEIQGNVNKVNGKSHKHTLVYWFVLGLHGCSSKMSTPLLQ